jgi:hypothetical protein
MSRRRLLAALILMAFCALLLGLNTLEVEDPSGWAETAAQGCRSHIFELPPSLLPPELAVLLCDTASQRDKELRSELLTSIHEFAGEALPKVPVNINCEQGSYDPSALNVYFVARDPEEQFGWAKGLILTRSDASRVIVLGPQFWSFFAQAWAPIWNWQNEASDPDFRSALGTYYLDIYDFYLKWAVTHEMGHIRLGHHAQRGLWLSHNEQGNELAADIEAARIMQRQYHLISGYLLGLVNETMKAGFYQTYHRKWQVADGDPLESEWKLRAVQCDRAHPPFVVRSLSMLEAASEVQEEQAREIQRQEEDGIKEALRQSNDIESQLALEELGEKRSSSPSRAPDSLLPRVQIVSKVRGRIIIEHPVFGICFDDWPSFLRKHYQGLPP